MVLILKAWGGCSHDAADRLRRDGVNIKFFLRKLPALNRKKTKKGCSFAD